MRLSRPDSAGPLLQSPAGGRRVRPLSVMKTYTAKPGEIQREWFLVDADGQTLGRLATRIADTLRGKGKPVYTPHVDTGGFVICADASLFFGSIPLTALRMTSVGRRSSCSRSVRCLIPPGYPVCR